ncbi:VanZ family protein [Deferrisoma camini]|uniref:VanZ family protein n=1 Tax=Deferrisoma camini TaxID=1035120 RepID=UPI00046D0F7B|nr:VanZ family protein [Deferrisoma camini]
MPTRVRSLLWRFGPPVLYMAVVFGLSNSSRPPLPRFLWALGDKPLHALEYVPMGYLWARALGVRGRRGLAWGFLAAAAFGATDEVHQWFVPRRQPSWLDWVADLVGASVGVGLWAAVRSRLPAGRGGPPRARTPAPWPAAKTAAEPPSECC